MERARQFSLLKMRHLSLLMFCALSLSACSRHGENEVRTLLDRWFALGEQVYFQSAFRCTAAVFDLRSTEPKSALRIENEMTRGLRILERTGIMALSLEGESPDQVFLAIMNANRNIGVPVQVAAVLSRDCMDLTTEGVFHAALTNTNSLFVWHGDEASIIILDPDQKVVVLASGVN